jgi:DNA-binding transcriptional LysR family regulator
VVKNFQELITAVAAGDAVCPVHEHARRYYARPDIRYLPISDPLSSTWALVWRTAADSRLVRAFVQVAEEIAPLKVQTGADLTGS